VALLEHAADVWQQRQSTVSIANCTQKSIHSIFGFGPEIVAPIAARALGKAMPHIRMETREREPGNVIGANSDSEILSVINTQGDSITMFVKRPVSIERVESRHYAAMKHISVATPILYSSPKDPSGHEVLFLEFIEQAKLSLADERQVEEAIRTIARINCSNPPAEYTQEPFIKTFNTEMQKFRESISVLYRKVVQSASRDKELLNQGRRLEMILDRVEAELSEWPFSLNLMDVHMDNFGWKEDSREIVLFDLDGLALRPRFQSIREFIYSFSNNTRCCWSGQPMVEVYLDEYRNLSGDNLPFQQFRKEAHATVAMLALRQLHWFIQRNKDDSDQFLKLLENNRHLKHLLLWEPIS